MNVVVVDASVLVKLFIDEGDSDQAELELSKSDLLIAPDLLLPETANILWKYVGRGELSLDSVEAILDDILQIPIRYTESQALIERALRIAIDTKRTVYDCLYIALAELAQTIVLTADERLANSVAATQYGPYVRKIGSAQ